MRKTILVIATIFMMFMMYPSVMAALDLTSTHTMKANMTFDAGYNLTTNFTLPLGGAWSITNVNAISGNALHYSSAGADSIAYILSDSFRRDPTKSYIMRGWTKTETEEAYHEFGYYNTTNVWEFVGLWPIGSTDNQRLFRTWQNGGVVTRTEMNPIGNYVNNNEYIWQVLNITGDFIEIKAYVDSSEASIIDQNQTIGLGKSGYFGFHAYRSSAFDNVEIWELGVEAAPTPTITLSTNIVNYGNYSDDPLVIYFNGSVQYTSDAGFNCSLTENLAPFAFATNKTGLNLSVNQNFTINTSDGTTFDGSGFWAANVSCTNNNVTGSFKRDNLFIDTLSPSYQIPNLLNNTIFWRNIDRIIDLTTRFTDLNLFAVNLTLVKLNQDGSRNQTLFNHFNQNMTGSSKTAYYANFTKDYTDNSSYTSSRYLVKLQAWDSHTANTLKYDIEKINDNTFVYHGVTIWSDKKITPDKAKDKYMFDVDKKAWLCYQSSAGFTKVENSEYPGHYVDFTNGLWVDEYTYTFIETWAGGKLTELCFFNDKDTGYKTSSIGDLNVLDQELFFNITDSFTFHAKDHFTLVPISNFTISIANATGQIQQKTASGTNVSFNITSGTYKVNITHPTYAANTTNITFTSGGNFTWDLFAGNSLYIFIYDEITDALLSNRTIAISVINYDNSTVNTSTITGWIFLSGFAPGRYEIRYKPENYTQRSYYTTVTSSSTQQLELFSLETAIGTYTNFVIEDETGNLIEGANLKVYRHFADCNCFKVVEMDLSNFNGVSTLFLQQYDGKYRFIIEKDGITLYSSVAVEGYRITETAYTLKVTTLGDTYASFYGTRGMLSNLTYSNATKLFYYTVNDPNNLVNRFCLYVDQLNALSQNGTDRICSNCLNASSGILTCNVTTALNNKREIIAKGWIHTNTTYSYYWDKIISIVGLSGAIDTLGTAGVFMGLFLTLTITFAAMALAGIYGAIAGVLLGLGISIMVGLIALDLVTFIGLVAIGVIIMVIIGGNSR